MVLPIATDGQQLLRQLIKDVASLKRSTATLQSGASTASEFTAETVLPSDVDNTNGMTLFQDVVMNADVVAEGQVADDGESILTDKQIWVVVPSAPLCTTNAQAVSVTWDGTGAGDERIPDNFGLVEIHRSTDEFFEVEGPETLVGVLALPGSIVFTGQEYGLPHYFRFVLTTSDGRRSQASDPGMGMSVEVGIGDISDEAIDEIQQGAIDISNAYTDEKVLEGGTGNAIHYSTDAPVAEPNNVGDIWFQRNAVNGRIIAQWFGAGGTTWEQTSLSHEVISSVDLGTATVGTLSADYIDTGILSADITVTGTLQAGDPAGGHLIFDADGLRQYTDATNTVINFSNDPLIPAQFEGAILAESITVTDNLTIQGTQNLVAQAAELRVGAGVQTTQSPVSLAVGYSTYDTGRFVSGGLYIPTGVHGNVDDSPDIYSASSFYGYGKFFGPSNKNYVYPERTDNAGTKRSQYGALSSSVMIHTAAGAERMLVMGLRCTNNGDPATGWISCFDMATMNSTGTLPPSLKVQMKAKEDDYTYETRLGRMFSQPGSSNFKERFIMANRQYLTNDFRLSQWAVTDTSFTLIAGYFTVADPMATDEKFLGVTYGVSDKMGYPGTSQFIWLLHGSVKTYAYTDARVRAPDYDFPTPAGAVRMTAYGNVATNEFIGFRTTTWADSTVVTKLTNNHWLSPTTDKWWVSSTWYDSDATGGTHETTQGPRAAITMPKRAGLTFTIPTYPDRPFPTTTDDVIAARVYLSRGASDPGRTYMERVTTLTAPTRGGYVGNWTFPASTAVSPPPVANNFPQTSPGKISSADGLQWLLQGNGQANIGGLEVQASGATYLTAYEIYLGDIAVATSRTIKWRRKATSGTNYYEIRAYPYDGTTTSGLAHVLFQNGVEETRQQLQPGGVMLLRDTPNGNTSYYRGDGVLSPSMRAQEYVGSLASYTTTSTTGTTGGTAGASGVFVAPPSGVVMFIPFATLRVSVAGQAAVLTYEVRVGGTVGSGAIQTAASIDRGPQNSNVDNVRSSWPTIVEGLTPGATYNCRTILMSGVTTSTATAAHTRLMMIPQP